MKRMKKRARQRRKNRLPAQQAEKRVDQRVLDVIDGRIDPGQVLAHGVFDIQPLRFLQYQIDSLGLRALRSAADGDALLHDVDVYVQGLNARLRAENSTAKPFTRVDVARVQQGQVVSRLIAGAEERYWEVMAPITLAGMPAGAAAARTMTRTAVSTLLILPATSSAPAPATPRPNTGSGS